MRSRSPSSGRARASPPSLAALLCLAALAPCALGLARAAAGEEPAKDAAPAKEPEKAAAPAPAGANAPAPAPAPDAAAAPAPAEPEAAGPEDDECLACHSAKGMQAKRGDATISLYVDKEKLEASVHGKRACVDCHAALKGKELPHPKGAMARVECGGCHDHKAQDDLHKSSLHGRGIAEGKRAPRCQDCHGSHEILKARDPRSTVNPIRVPELCGKCHKQPGAAGKNVDAPTPEGIDAYTESIHGEGLLKKGLVVAATCASCHTAHRVLPHTDPESSIARKNIAATCTQCHAQIEQVHRKIIKGELWEKEAHILPACVDCHQPHTVRKVFYDQGMADRDCLVCHEKPDLNSSDGRRLTVMKSILDGSRHSKVSCSQCHSGVNLSSSRPCETVGRKVDCAACHAEIAAQYAESMHGQLFAKGDVNAPTCRDCHGTHGIQGKRDNRSVTFPTNVPTLCARCHREGEKAALRYSGTEHEITKRYSESIHGKGLLKSGLVVTAMCTDCHTSHRELPRKDPRSSVHPDNLPATCGRCHNGIEEQFVKSIHSPLVSGPGKNLPVCNDCHSAHTISRTDETGFRLQIMNTCGRCHEEIAETYFDTYHGKVSQLGFTKTAKCYDCHGAHDILPVTDPGSHLSRENVIATCKKCHEGASRRFAGYLTHATHHDPAKYPFLFWTFWGMTGLLVSTFFFGGLHTLLWLPRAFLHHRALPPVHADPDEKRYVRFSHLNRTLHIVMIVSFMSLALTGMSLKFSYTGWARVLSRFFGGFESAGYIHRVAAVVMMGVFAAHIFDLFRRKRREFGSWAGLLLHPDSMLPTFKDLRDAVSSVKWFLGLGPRPQYGRWTYWEKFDYFAVFWGIAIIGSTGMLLWFSEFFTHLVPGWVLNVATIIHSDEALLAVGFIFTIHFFNTHLRPEKFPMDLVVFTGQMPVEELKRDKPLEYERLVKSGELEKHLAPPYPAIVVRTIRVFAWIALAIGFSIVVWIIYAMLFAYR